MRIKNALPVVRNNGQFYCLTFKKLKKMNEKFLILLVDKHCYYHRNFVWCDTLERAQKLAREYTKDNKYTAEIYTNCESVE